MKPKTRQHICIQDDKKGKLTMLTVIPSGARTVAMFKPIELPRVNNILITHRLFKLETHDSAPFEAA